MSTCQSFIMMPNSQSLLAFLECLLLCFLLFCVRELAPLDSYKYIIKIRSFG